MLAARQPASPCVRSRTGSGRSGPAPGEAVWLRVWGPCALGCEVKLPPGPPPQHLGFWSFPWVVCISSLDGAPPAAGDRGSTPSSGRTRPRSMQTPLRRALGSHLSCSGSGICFLAEPCSFLAEDQGTQPVVPSPGAREAVRTCLY